MKKNRRTLKNKIRRYIFLSFLSTTLIFISVIGFLGSNILRPFITNSTNYIAASIALKMNAKDFLEVHKLNSLSEFNEKSAEYKYWYKDIDRSTSLKISSAEFSHLFPQAPNNRMDVSTDGTDTNDRKTSYDSKNDLPITFVEIKLNDVVLYSNLKEHKFTDSTNSLDIFSYVSTCNLGEKNNPIGTVKSQINPDIIHIALWAAAALLFIAFLVSFIGALIISRLSTLPIIKPILQLEKKILAISLEDFEATLNSQIFIKKPLKEIESITNATNEIMQKMKSYSLHFENQNKILESQNIELESQNTELLESTLQIEKAQEKLAKQEKSVRMLLDNAGQGFLSFGPSLFIHDEYSKECISILGMEIKNSYFPELFFYQDEEQKNFMESVLKRILTETNRNKKEIYLPLLNNEIKINNKIVHMSYKIINDLAHGEEDLMVILTDITDKRNLETVIEQERNILKMVVKVVVNYTDFMKILADYTHFYKVELKEIFNKGYSLVEILSLIYREVHTFKGSFSQIYMSKVVSYLHDIESNLTDIKKDENNTTIEDFKIFIEDCSFENLLEEDLTILKEILGEEFFNREAVIMIDKHQFIEIERKMLSVLSPFECKLLLPHLRSLRYKSFNDLLQGYCDYSEKLAGNLNKMINPLRIEGDNILVDDDQYHNFTKSLVHVFRNILDHGIESPEERVENDKSELGNITCKINLVDNDTLSLRIEDDGRGIDISKLLEKAIEKGLCSKEDSLKLNKDEILNYMFYDGISTKGTVSSLSGRGIGLAAVKSEVDKLKGTIHVKTTPNFGTEFEFLLPYAPLNLLPEISVSSILNPLLETTVAYTTSDMNLQLVPCKCVDISKSEKLSLSKFTIFIEIKGFIQGRVILSLDEEIAKIITHNFILEEVTFEEEINLMEDALAEFSNIIVGNSFNSLPMIQDLITMEAPITINSENASFASSSSQIWTTKLVFNSGIIDLSFMTSESIVVDA